MFIALYASNLQLFITSRANFATIGHRSMVIVLVDGIGYTSPRRCYILTSVDLDVVDFISLASKNGDTFPYSI